MESEVKAFAPVNIAWIKYMGKLAGKPANSSLSLTLKNTGTTVKLRATSGSPLIYSNHRIIFDQGSYEPPASGTQKLETFLFHETRWKDALEPFGYRVELPSWVHVWTQNNAPAASGVATSASSFAAFTLAWAALIVWDQRQAFERQFETDPKLRKKISELAGKGSGSACRSLDGPWVEWNPKEGVSASKLSKTNFGDLIFLVDSSPKTVSSSDAHARIQTSPRWEGRIERSESRLKKLKPLLRESALPFQDIQALVWEESQDMHELFHTAVPAFRYQTEKSLEIANAVLSGRGPSKNAVLTMDAGANVHVFFPIEEKEKWESFARTSFSEVPVILDCEGSGAHYAH